MAADRSAELLAGTLELMVLKALSLEPMHGWGLAQRIEQMSRDVLQVSQGSLYPALQRMKRKGWVRSEWRTTENKRRARYYLLTPAGARQLEREKATWEAAYRAVNWVLSSEGGAA
jgi:transcriptional regulator